MYSCILPFALEHFGLPKYFHTELWQALILEDSSTLCYDVYFIKKLRNNILNTVACLAVKEH